MKKMKVDKSIINGTCYIGVVGSELENGQCYDSIIQMQKRPGDAMQQIRATKGYEARQQHFNNFIESKHDFLFLMDADMVFPELALERLRSHGLAYVSGLYMRRRYAPMAPIWFENTKSDVPNYKWWTGQIIPNRIYEIGASGWGCVLIHRSVVEATRAILKGEPEVIEDDMDVWPYDLARVTNSINRLAEMTGRVDPLALQTHVKVLQDEIRPLRAIKEPIGSDVRYPFFARKAGFQMYGDSGVFCGHMLSYPLSPMDYEGTREDYKPEMTAGITKEIREAWKREGAKIAARKAEL